MQRGDFGMGLWGFYGTMIGTHEYVDPSSKLFSRNKFIMYYIQFFSLYLEIMESTIYKSFILTTRLWWCRSSKLKNQIHTWQTITCLWTFKNYVVRCPMICSQDWNLWKAMFFHYNLVSYRLALWFVLFDRDVKGALPI